MRPGVLALLLTGLAPLAPAAAQPTAPAQPDPTPAMAAPATAAVDPARFAAAERLVALVMPPEVMRRMLGLPMAGMDAVMDMTPEDLGLGEQMQLSETDLRRPMRELVAERDPHFRERLEIRSRVMGEVLGEVMLAAQPEFTRAMAEFYAMNLSLEELDAAIAYYSTPGGRRFAGVAANVMQDPAFARLMTRIAPRFVEAMGTIEERVRAASAHLPPEPRPEAAAAPAEE